VWTSAPPSGGCVSLVVPQGFSSPLTTQGGSHAQRHCRRWTCSSSRPLPQHPLGSPSFEPPLIAANLNRSSFADTDGGAPTHPLAQGGSVAASEAVPMRSERHTVRGGRRPARRRRSGAQACRGSRAGSRRSNVRVSSIRRRRVAIVCLREDARRRRLVSVASHFRQTTTATHVDTRRLRTGGLSLRQAAQHRWTMHLGARRTVPRACVRDKGEERPVRRQDARSGRGPASRPRVAREPPPRTSRAPVKARCVDVAIMTRKRTAWFSLVIAAWRRRSP
jgi:hypothetical protein